MADWSKLLTAVPDEELPAIWVEVMKELRARGLITSWNNPVADLAEHQVARHLGLTLAGASTQGYDAIDGDGLRYQVKARRLTPQNPSRQLGIIRKLDDKEFDFLVAVIYDEDLQVEEMWRIPHVVVQQYAKWVSTLNGHRLFCRGAVLTDSRILRLI